ncbi:hypothetical protein AAF712_014474 [Marasmius tenuissimus]|uniref:Uncharacterized protein n=1 Tax=Marasmius tenuissimus TaxID=585030 RepID=A0ABR2ZBZ3_9AGAR
MSNSNAAPTSSKKSKRDLEIDRRIAEWKDPQHPHHRCWRSMKFLQDCWDDEKLRKMRTAQELTDLRNEHFDLREELTSTKEQLERAEEELTHLRQLVTKTAGTLLDGARVGKKKSPARAKRMRRLNLLPDTPKKPVKLLRPYNDWVLDSSSPTYGPVEEVGLETPFYMYLDDKIA